MRLLFLGLALLLGFVGLVAAPEVASAQQLRFSTNAPGRLIGTGNALGLSKGLNENGPGVHDSIGTFITLNTSSIDNNPLDTANPWPTSTTNDWTQNGSTALLTLPAEPKVLYAELVWGGSTNYGGEDVRPFLDNAVTLTSGTHTLSVNPDPATKLTIAQTAATGFAANYYMRSANVTSFVQTAGTGTYSVQGVPATQAININSLNAAGWTLIVAVRDDTQPVRNLSVFVGGSFVDENSTQDYTVSGFCTPPSGPFAGHVVISAIEGDANLTGDQLLIAPTGAGPFVNLSGPNNPANNFFCSQINGSDGLIDTNGTFGNKNADAQTGTNISGGRQSWDVTTVGVSSQAGQLVNGQQSAVLRTITTGDSYVPIVAAFAIDVNAPVFTTAATQIKVDKTTVVTGDSITTTLTLTNAGLVTAQNVKLKLPLMSGLGLTSYTTEGANGDINGTPVNASGLATGADAGTLAPGQARHIVIGLTVTGPPPASAANVFSISPEWDYAYVICAGGSAKSESFSQVVNVTYTPPTSSSTASSSSASSTSAGTASNGTGTASGTASNGTGTASGTASNGTGTGSNTGTGTASGTPTGAGGGTGAGGAPSGAGGSSGSGAGVTPGKGCGCAVPGSTETPWTIGFAALGAAALIGRRRRR